MAELDTNFVDAVLSANMNGKKRVRLTQIAENEYIVEDITEYEKVGSEYGQKEINTLNETVNGKVNKVEVIDDLDTVKAVTEDNVPVGCKAVTKFANDVNQSLNKLNEGSKLKLLGNANGNTPIDITRYISNYSELLISVTLGNTPYRITINIPPAELVDSDITYQSGSRASASIGTVVNVQCSRKRVLLTAVIVNDNDVLAYSTIRIYGRK